MKRLLFVFLGVTALTTMTYSNKVTIQVSDFQFTPDLLTVQLGDTVVFQWSSGVHTATSTNVPAGAASFDELITGDITEFEYVPAVIGVYNYVCTPHADMGMDGSFTVEQPAGINDKFVESAKVTVWPNPASDILNIAFDQEIQSEVSIEIYNMAGQRLLHTTVMPNWGNKDTQLQIGHLPSGVYAIGVSGTHRSLRAVFVVR